MDHLVLAARTLDEGAAWIVDRMGEEPVPGGQHVTMGTHNRLLSLGGRQYLEVIAIDPDAPPPQRPRWFELDRAPMVELLAQGPALIHWVARTPDIERDVRARGEGMEILDFSRGDFRWRMALRQDGRLPRGGNATIIQWLGDIHPADRLPASSCRLSKFTRPAAGAAVRFDTLRGPVEIPWTVLD